MSGPMSRVVSTASPAIVDPAHADPAMRYSDLALGLLIVAIVPALFWTAMIWLIAVFAGFAPTWGHLASTALGIATPPACIWAAVAVRE